MDLFAWTCDYDSETDLTFWTDTSNPTTSSYIYDSTGADVTSQYIDNDESRILNASSSQIDIIHADVWPWPISDISTAGSFTYLRDTSKDILDIKYFTKLSNGINTYTIKDPNAVKITDIVDDTISTDIDKPLSANMGKSLQDQLDNLKARGRFLALWNCATGLAESNPPESPYTYQSGDFFIVGTVGSGTNYRPNGASYTTGVASTTVETETVDVDDVYYYDGTNWRLQINTQKTVSFANIAGQPSDNTNLAAALNTKQNLIDSNNKLSADLVDDTATTNKFVTASQQSEWSSKQNYLVAGENITLSPTTVIGKNKLDADCAGLTQTATPAQNIALNFERWYLGVAYNGYMGTGVASITHSVGSVTFKSSDNSYGVCKFVRLKPNTQYIVSCANSTNNHKCGVACYIDNGNNTYKATTYISTPQVMPLRFTTNSNEVYGIILYSPTNTEITYTKLQLEEGTNATTYVDYSSVPASEISSTSYTAGSGISVSNHIISIDGLKINTVSPSSNVLSISPENFNVYSATQPSQNTLTVSFDLSSIVFNNCEKVWELWIDFQPYYVENTYTYTDGATSTSKSLTQRDYTKPSVTWDSKISWLFSEPELTVYGKYKFRFFASDSGHIIGKQIYPTVIPWENEVVKSGYTYMVNGGTATSTTAIKPYYGTGNTIIKIRYTSYNSSWPADANMIINYYRQAHNGTTTAVDELFCLGKTRYGERLLIKPNYTMENFSFNLGANVKGYQFKQVDVNSYGSQWGCDIEKRQANELENLAYSQGWRG